MTPTPMAHMRREAPQPDTDLAFEATLALTLLDSETYGATRPHSYFAGVFDGEGTIGLYVHADGNPRVMVRVKMTYRPIIAAFAAQYGGSIYDCRHTDRAAKAGHAPAYEWKLCSRKSIAAFLPIIYPWLIEKRSQAHTLMIYLEQIAQLGAPSVDHGHFAGLIKSQKKVA